MAAKADSDWATDSTEALNVSLVIPDSGNAKAIAAFKPEFTYALFGDKESIFGYKDLDINIQFNASDMRPNVSIHYTKKYKQIGSTQALDLQPILGNFLPAVAFQKNKAFVKHINSGDIYQDWKPPGTRMFEFKEGPDKRRFEVWRANATDDDTVHFLNRIQILVPFLIDGGTVIDLAEDGSERWTLFFLFEHRNDLPKKVSPYIFMGYATVYRYYPLGFANQEKSKADENPPDFHLPWPKKQKPSFCFRPRLSQFIILPPFQGYGHAARLYQSIYSWYLAMDNVIELTVEDPNEAFDNLRDANDLIFLRTCPVFRDISINPNIKIDRKGRFPMSEALDTKALEQLRVQTKIAPRQFYRVLEMQLLSKIPASVRQTEIYVEEKKKEGKPSAEDKKGQHLYHLWRLIVKTRLHRHNREALMQIDHWERPEHLDAATLGVQAGYEAILEKVDKKSFRFVCPEIPPPTDTTTSSPAPAERSGATKKRSADSARISGADGPPAKKSKLKSNHKTLATRAKPGKAGKANDIDDSAAPPTTRHKNVVYISSDRESGDEGMDSPGSGDEPDTRDVSPT